jgi:hypothetical protein
MAQKPNAKAVKAGKKSPFSYTALNLFLAGCCAECYAILLRRFYVYGTLEQMLGWDSALPKVLYAGLGVAAAGLILALLLLRHPGSGRTAGWSLLGSGLFVAGATWFARTFYATGVKLLCLGIPVLVLLGVLLVLYDRECFWAMSVLCVTILTLWICRHGVGNMVWNTRVRIGACCYLVLMGVLFLLVRRIERSDGLLGRVRILPEDTDCLVLYLACGLSAATVLLSLFSAVIAYYAMWTVAVVAFALLVYYTVKQL